MNPKLILEPGRYYHIYNRGNNRCKLFYEERNYDYFLRLYLKYIKPIADTYAWVLMGNHFHLLIKVRSNLIIDGKKLEPSRQFSHLFNAYAQAINKSVGRTGSLFEHTFERKEVTTKEYMRQLVVYIHQNPQKHRFADYFKSYPWSSFDAIIKSNTTLIKIEEVLDLFGGLENFIQAHNDKYETSEGNLMIECKFS